MDSLYLGLKFLHYLSMALWIAAALQLTGKLRALSNDPGPDNPAFKSGPGGAGIFGHLGAAGILATGVGLIVWSGGMGAVPWPIHLALTLALGLWGLLAFADRGLASVHGAIASGDANPDALKGRLGSLRMMTVGFHMGWTAILVLMVWRNVIA
ncbi:MAG: hypothetical protein AAGA48_29255 [Myxococcota bacterium]